MKLWWLSSKRSARRRARRDILAGRVGSRWSDWGRLPAVLARRLDWLPPALASLILSGPLYGFVGHRPGWLSAAWPVSAVLLGFVIPLLVFLLQAVGSGRLRAARTYRVVIADSAVAWPTFFSLLLIVWVAVIERFSGHGKAAAWVTTWSLGFFLMQWAALLVVFVRSSRLLAPAGVTRALGRSLEHDIERAVVERLTRQQATQMYGNVWAGVADGALPSLDGFEVTLGRAGYIDDFDLMVPVELEARETAKEMRGLWLVLGDKVKAGAVIARMADAPDADTEKRLRGGVRVRRHPRVSADWAEVFRDVVDLALGALESGRSGDVDLAVGVIVSGLTKVPETYRRYGSEYDSAAVHGIPWQRNEEDEMLEELSRMSSFAAASTRADALVELVALPYQLAVAAVDGNVSLLLDQALVLWLRQARDARAIGGQRQVNAVNERIHRLSSSLAHQLVFDFEKKQLPVEERLRAADWYQRISWFRATLMKVHIDAEDLGAVGALWSEVTSRVNTADPVRDRMALEQQLARATDETQKSQLEGQLSTAASIAGAFETLIESRGWDWFRVGAWAAWQYRHGRISQETWDVVAVKLANPFQDGTVAARLGEIVSTRDRVRELDSWDRDLQDIRPSSEVWQPRDSEIALFWAALLLLRGTDPARPPNLPVDSAFSYADQLVAHVDRIEHQALWHGLISGDVTGKAAAVRSALQASKDAAMEQARERARQDATGDTD